MERSSYQVLARKWRPQQFDEVVGQRPIVRTLVNALQQGRTAHAYCFSGIRGVGKTTIARLLAKGLNCRSFEGPTATPCGTCESCVEIMEGRSLDVFERDAASDRGIHEMKELLEIARYAPSRDRYKVMILDEAHMLTPEASNALLKLLEEPPAYIVFALATTEPNKILPTILSRCQHYQLSRISQREIQDHLAKMAAAEGIAISADGLALVATAADGSLRDAQSLLDKLIAFAGDSIDEATVVELLGLIDKVLLFRAVDLIADENVAGVLELVNEMVEQGIDLHQVTIDLLGHFRNLLIVRTVSQPGEILHLPAADLDTLAVQAQRFEIDDLDRAFTLVAGSEYRIKMAAQPRYHLELVLARLARMPRLQPIEDLLAALQDGGSGKNSPPRGGGTRRSREPAPAATRASAAASAPAAPVKPAAASEQPAPPKIEAAATTSGLLGKIQAKLGETHPLLAQSLSRTCGIDIAGETLVFRFPPTTGLFADRLKDPEVMPALRAACEAALGRSVAPRVEIDANAPTPAPRPKPKPAAEPPRPARAAPEPQNLSPPPTDANLPHPAEASPAHPQAVPPPEDVAPAADTRPSSAPTETEAGPPPRRLPTPASPELRRQVENEPAVQALLTELKGSVLSVEEL